MTTGTVSGDIVDKMCELFGRWAMPGKLERTHKNNVAVYWNTQQLGLVKFNFVTRHDMNISVNFDMADLARGGKAYIDTTVESVKAAIDDFHKERMKDASNINIVLPTDNKLAASVGKAVRTVH